MWTSSYLPGRRIMALSAALVLLALGLLGLVLHLPRCPFRAPAPAAEAGIPVRLHIAGTPGACVRLDGQVLGPIPAEVELSLKAPRRVFLHACKRGYLDFGGELELVPGEEVTQHLWLPRYRLLRHGGPVVVPRPLLRCTCQRSR